MATDYADWGGLAALQQFITSLNLAVQTEQATAAQIAAEIAIEGAPLLHGYSDLLSVSPSIAPGGSYSVFIPCSKNGYSILLNQGYSGTPGATPFLQVQMRWWNLAETADIGTMANWYVPILDSGVYGPCLGGGPVRGPVMGLVLVNHDPAETVSAGLDVQETSLHIARDDIRQGNMFGSFAPNGFTMAPGADLGGLFLANCPVTTFAPGNTTYYLPLYAGAAWLCGEGALSGLTFTIQPAYPANSGPLFSATLPASQPWLQEQITMPRVPCTVTIHNSNATSTNGSFTIAAQEYVS